MFVTVDRLLSDCWATVWAGGADLEQSGEDVKLKDGDVVVAGQVDGGLEGHGLQTQADGVELMESLTERSPRHDGPGGGGYWSEGHGGGSDSDLDETSLVSEGASPELCSVGLGDPEVVSLEQTVGEDGFELGEHVAEDQGQLGQVPPEDPERREEEKSEAETGNIW